ncbi:sensor histidine kinase [Actinosynnema sp. NPDC020468]|uniref:sensor histidine kinase n=1 Tax=Actinosynnema sp. NPDC020468 TaxID=3154488 RepID=UPI0033C0FB9E
MTRFRWHGTTTALAVALYAALRAPRPDASGWLFAILLALPFVGLPLAPQRHPAAVLTAVVSVGALGVVIGTGTDAVALATALALYPVVTSSPGTGIRPTIAALAGIAAAGLLVVAVPALPLIPTRPNEESFATTPLSALLFSTVVLTGTWLVATTIRARRRRAAELADLRTARAVAEERLRMARDIHDVVGHNLSLITMKAAVATHLATGAPDDRDAALRTIEQVGRAALDDVRTVLDAVREPSAPIDLDRLVHDAREAGVQVEVTAADLTTVPPPIRVAAYRIAQEALTNVRRHAHPPRCHLTTTTRPGLLTVTVTDEGHPTAPGTPGHGQLGMRERASLHGGTVHFGLHPSGGYTVEARLPFTPEPNP